MLGDAYNCVGGFDYNKDAVVWVGIKAYHSLLLVRVLTVSKLRCRTVDQMVNV